MKQVVEFLGDHSKLVPLAEVDNGKYYGTVISSIKCMVTRSDKADYSVIPISTDDFSGIHSSSLKDCIDTCIHRLFPVYEFDNLKEFAEWLVKECN